MIIQLLSVPLRENAVEAATAAIGGCQRCCDRAITSARRPEIGRAIIGFAVAGDPIDRRRSYQGARTRSAGSRRQRERIAVETGSTCVCTGSTSLDALTRPESNCRST